MDVREISASLHLLVHRRLLRTSIFDILGMIYSIFCSEAAPYFAITRSDLIRVFTLPVLYDSERHQVMSYLENWLPVRHCLSRAAFLKRVKDETQDSEYGWLRNENLCMVFQRCAWACLSPNLRIKALQAAEERVVANHSYRMQLRRKKSALELCDRQRKRRSINRWKGYILFYRRLNECRHQAYARRAKRGLRRWHERIAKVRWEKMKALSANMLGDFKNKLDKVRRLKLHAKRMKHIYLADRAKPDRKRAIDGCKNLRAFFRIKDLKEAIKIWFQEAWIMGAMEAAKYHEEWTLLRRVFMPFKRYTRIECDRRAEIRRMEKIYAETDYFMREHAKETEVMLAQKKKEEEEEAARLREEVCRARASSISDRRERGGEFCWGLT